MSDSKWKPTEEMVKSMQTIFVDTVGYYETINACAPAALIAVQPLIEAEALERAYNEVYALMTDETFVGADHWNQCVERCAMKIRAMIQKEPGT